MAESVVVLKVSDKSRMSLASAIFRTERGSWKQERLHRLRGTGTVPQDLRRQKSSEGWQTRRL